ncbi:MAG: transporter substrate-binding domain-containing protein [Lachnospiraceae bacterium]|nr:transporter substrate-binding domain-containing protein [Lachnospiraceae bacterium]
MKLKKMVAVMMTGVLLATSFTACGKSTKGSKQVKVINIDLTDEEYAFGVDKDQPQLLEEVNNFIKTINDDGTFDQICERYFGDGGKPEGVKSAELDDNKDQLVVATNAEFEPFEYMEGDTYYGIDMEIAAALAKHLGKELVIQNMSFDAVCLTVGQHKCDIAMAGLTVKPEREEFVTFSDSYYAASQRLIVMKNNTEFDNCKTTSDVEKILNDKAKDCKVGVQNGTTGQLYCEGDEEWEFKGFGFTTKGYANGALAVQDMINGNINYVIIDSAPAKAITGKMNKMN